MTFALDLDPADLPRDEHGEFDPMVAEVFLHFDGAWGYISCVPRSWLVEWLRVVVADLEREIADGFDDPNDDPDTDEEVER